MDDEGVGKITCEFVRSNMGGRMKDHPWSRSEKQVICRLVGPSNPLPYPLQKRKCPNGDYDMVYLMPQEDKERELRRCWPFQVDCPDMDMELTDVHCMRKFKFRDSLIIYSEQRNIIVCPDYFEFGGMVVDMMPPDESGCVHTATVDGEKAAIIEMRIRDKEEKDEAAEESQV